MNERSGPAHPGAEEGARALRVRPYTLTGGRTKPATALPIEALVLARPQVAAPQRRLSPEQAAILALASTPVSLAEISARLAVPLGVARVLVDDLLAEALVDVRGPASAEERPDAQLLERVLHGLQAL